MYFYLKFIEIEYFFILTINNIHFTSEEIQRKIIIMCEKSNAVRNISITSKSFYSLGIQKHFIPKAILFSVLMMMTSNIKENRETI